MVKKLILASSVALAMMACSSKGNYTCTCKPNNTDSDGDLRYSSIKTIVMTEVPKSVAEEECINAESSGTYTQTRTTTSNNNGVNSTDTKVDTYSDASKSNCTLTEK